MNLEMVLHPGDRVNVIPTMSSSSAFMVEEYPGHPTTLSIGHDTLPLRSMAIGGLRCWYVVHRPRNYEDRWVCYYNGDEEWARCCARGELLDMPRPDPFARAVGT